MASASGRDVPEERVAAVANDLVEAREGLATLKIFLLQLDDHRATHALQVVDGILDRLSSATSALDVSGAAAVEVQSPAAAGSGSGGSRPQQSVSSSGGNKKKRIINRRSQRPSDTKITTTLDDGHVWRKYGQKDIQNSTNPRSYYRCTHKSDQGCNAKRQVQRSSDTDQYKFIVTYYGEHTCRDPSTIPLVVHAAAEPPDSANNLISFGPSSTNNNAAAASTGASSSQYLAAMGDQLSTSWCTSGDDVFSSSAASFMTVDELIGAVVVGSAGVTSTAAVGSSAMDRGGGLGGTARGGGDTASFPSSPHGLGFVVGSLGSIDDDDDLFPMDP